MPPGIDPAWGALWTLATCRIGGMLALAPWWDPAVVPGRWRVVLGLLLTLLVVPTLAENSTSTGRRAAATATTGEARTDGPAEADGAAQANGAVSPGWDRDFWLLAAEEVGLGAVTGAALRIVWMSIAWTVQLIGPLSGLSLGEVFDPGTGESAPAIGRLLRLTALAAWLGAGGHRTAIAALLDTFQAAPLGAARLERPALDWVLDLFRGSCLAGVKAGAPLAAVLLTGWVVVAALGRIAPRSSAWIWSASLASVLGIVGLSLTLSYMSWTYQEQVTTTLESIGRAWAEWAPGVEYGGAAERR